MIRSSRAATRLLRGTAHCLHGLVIVLLRFPSYAAAERELRIQWWAGKMLRVLGIRLQVEGLLSEGGTLLVANHISWLDIMAVHAVYPHARFVSKADVKSWPLLARLIDAGGTLYLERERKRDALRVVHTMAAALQAGQMVVVFPEGTTTDGRAMLPFHANLLQAAIATGTPVQPVALRFSDATHPVSRAVEFIGDTTLLQSLWRVAQGEGITARVALLPARESAEADRRTLAKALQRDIETRLAQPM